MSSASRGASLQCPMGPSRPFPQGSCLTWGGLGPPQPEPVSVLTFEVQACPPPAPPQTVVTVSLGPWRMIISGLLLGSQDLKSMPSVEPGFMQLGVDMLFSYCPPLSRQDF